MGQNAMDELPTVPLELLIKHYLELLAAGCVVDVEQWCQLRPDLPHLRTQLANAKLVQIALNTEASSGNERPRQTEGLTSSWSGDEAIPDTVGGFKLIRCIGRGSFGSVFEAVEPVSAKHVAFKLLHRRDDSLAHADRNSVREYSLLSSIHHPSVVRVIGSGYENERPYVVMELIEGLDLRRQSQSQRLSATGAAYAALNVASALGHLHRCGIVHRDVKPENVILSRETGIAMLSDFGVAKRLDSQTAFTSPNCRIGTLEYAAPEWFDSSLGVPGRQSDIYSLGASLFFMLTSRLAFRRSRFASDAALLAEIRKESWKAASRLLSHVPVDLVKICRKCMEPFPDDRYETADQLCTDLEQFLSGGRVQIRPVSLSKRVRNLGRRRPVVASVVAGSVAASVMVIAISRNLTREAVQARVQSEGRTYNSEMRRAPQLWADAKYEELDLLLRRIRMEQADADSDFSWRHWMRVTRPQNIVTVHDKGAKYCRLRFSPNGDSIAAIGRTGTISVLDAASGKTRYSLSEPASDCLFSQDGSHLFSLPMPGRNELVIHNSSSGHKIRNFLLPFNVTSATVHPRGNWLLLGSETGELRGVGLKLEGNAEKPPGLFIRGLPKNKNVNPRSRSEEGGDVAAVSCLEFSAMNPHWLVVGYANGETELWESVDDWKTWEIRIRGPRHDGPVTGAAMVFSKAPYIATQALGLGQGTAGDYEVSQVKVWHGYSGYLHTSLRPHNYPIERSDIDALTAGSPQLMYRPSPKFLDPNTIFTTGDTDPLRWEVSSGARLSKVPGTGKLVVGIDVNSRTESLASVDSEGTVTIASPPSRSPDEAIYAAPFKGFDFEISGDGKTIVLIREQFNFFSSFHHKRTPRVLADEFEICLLNSEDGEVLYRRNVSQLSDFKPMLSADGRTYVYNGVERAVPNEITGRIKTWERVDTPLDSAPSFDTVTRFSDGLSVRIGKDSSTVSLYTLGGADENVVTLRHDSTIRSTALDPDGRYVATSTSNGGLYVWDSRTSSVARSIQVSGSVSMLSFHPTERLLAGVIGREIHIWNSATGESVMTLSGHRSSITGVTFLPNSKLLVSCSGGLKSDVETPGEVFLWDLSQQERRTELLSLRQNVYCGVVASPDGKRIYGLANSLATGSDAEILLWDSSAASP